MTIHGTEAQRITQCLGGHWWRSYGTAPCPACQPEAHKTQNALTLHDARDGRLLAHCKRGCSFADVLDALRAAGLVSGRGRPRTDKETLARRRAEDAAQAAKRERQALRLWREAVPIAGTVAERYLRGRGITCDLPPSLRFHGACWHGPTARRLPAMVAAIEGAERAAVHRTYLREDGRGKAEAEPNKMMLGGCLGGAVRLADGPDGLAVAEGIETALSLACCGLMRGRPSVWAALSAAGVAGLRLPDRPGKLTICPDGDTAGREAANKLARRAAALGWQVSLLPAPEGRDWNDVLRAGAKVRGTAA